MRGKGNSLLRRAVPSWDLPPLIKLRGFMILYKRTSVYSSP